MNEEEGQGYGCWNPKLTDQVEIVYWKTGKELK